MAIQSASLTIGRNIDEANPTKFKAEDYNNTIREGNYAIFENQVEYNAENPPSDEPFYNVAENEVAKAYHNMILTRKNAFICTGSSNAYIVSTDTTKFKSPLGAYTSGLEITFTPNHINTGASTVNVDGLGVVNLVKKGNIALTSGQLMTEIVARYNSAGYFEIISGVASNLGGNKKFSVNSGASNFITSSNNNTITINGSVTPLVYTYANGESVEQTNNQNIALDQNGIFLVAKDDFDNYLVPTVLNFRANSINTKNTLYRLLNQVTNATANFTNGNNVLSNISGIDWTKVAIGQTITSLIAGLATSFTINGTTTNGSNIITGVTSTLWSSIFKGQVITGSGIPANTIITNFDQNAGTITLSANATGGGTSTFTLSASPKIASFSEINNTITLDLPCTATTTASAIQIHSNVDLALATSYFKVGMAIAGTNIPVSSTISSIDPAIGSITLNNNATATTQAISGLTASQTGFYESTTAPSTANDGELWVNINPLKTYKRVSGSWAESSYVNLGEATKSNGVIGSIISYRFNGFNRILSNISAQDLTQNHNIGSSNIYLQLLLIALTDNNGYIVGDKATPITVDFTTNTGGSFMSPITSIKKNSCNILISQSIRFISKATNLQISITVGNTDWIYELTASRTY
jgi:hypothetical protein